MTSPPRTICILTGNHLCHNPRVLKEADTLNRLGYELHVLGAAFDADLSRRDAALMNERPWRFTPVVDMTAASATLARNWLRLRRAAACACSRRLALPNALQTGYCAPELLRAARRCAADLYIAHSEQALWVAERLHGGGRRVAVDMEDWYSEDLPPEARNVRERSWLRAREATLLSSASYVSCPSDAMSRALSDAYRCGLPMVLYNAFGWQERAGIDGRMRDRSDASAPSIHWYSQTIGQGRGLEDLLRALPLLRTPVQVHLRGNLPLAARGWLDAIVPAQCRERIFVHRLVSNPELLSRVAEHDIGFAGEMQFCRNRDLTVTNKILHYLLAGIAVVASDTAGQREVAEKAPGAVFLYQPGDAHGLAAALNKLLSEPAALAGAKAAALEAARETFCWERQAPVLLAAVEEALA